ncbi:hypothetical protein [Mobilicoccus sp.]|uniref:hypothetical protein n=1 Tax=Mobilicoccus sp. TaxID=2034349 RepID=UPI00289D86CF|nr:hypothetical protein [Mobilicoccus sp.]
MSVREAAHQSGQLPGHRVEFRDEVDDVLRAPLRTAKDLGRALDLGGDVLRPAGGVEDAPADLVGRGRLLMG